MSMNSVNRFTPAPSNLFCILELPLHNMTDDSGKKKCATCGLVSPQLLVSPLLSSPNKSPFV